MSWRKAGALARELADAARSEADAECNDDVRLDAFRKYMQEYYDKKAMASSMRRRKAQHLEEFAGECDRHKDTDITVVEFGKKR